MNVRDLIDLLEDAATELGDDASIQLATQSHYPLRYHLAGVYVDPDEQAFTDQAEESEPTVWLVEGSQHRENPYGVPEDAWNDVRRS